MFFYFIIVLLYVKGAFDMAKEKKNAFTITFRAPVDVVQRLDEMCAMMTIKRSEFLINAICSEYDKICGNPQLNKLLLQMREITDTLKHMNGCSSVPGVSSDYESGVDGDL